MRSIESFALATLLSASVALAGCGQAPAASQGGAANETVENETVENETTENETAPQKLVGGWQVFEDTTPACTDEEKAVFDEAVGTLDGVGYELVRVLGTQVVSGRNYAFLARGTTVTAEPVTTWYVVVAYQDLDGNVSLTSVQPIDLAEPKVTSETSSANIVGGWELLPPSNAVLEPQEVGEAFGKAAESYADVTLYPIATLGSQVVSGTNYLVLCEGEPATEEARMQLYLGTLYVDLQGNAQLNDVRGFDLLSYIG